jgi:signal recognition particle subunit SRP68
MGEDVQDVVTPQEKFSLAVHQVIDLNQASHGLRHDDYKQYHSYCTRRLSRLRHARPVRRDLVHSAVYVSGAKMRCNAYCPRNDMKLNHENALWVVLLEAERAWAHSCELKALMATSGKSSTLAAEHEKSRSSPGKIRQHALRRLKRARQLATQFQELAEQVGDERTILEAKAYGGWMRGNWGLEVGDWKVRNKWICIFLECWCVYMRLTVLLFQQSACEEYAAARSICLSLSQAVEDDSLELRDLFTSRADSVLQPLLRYCQYEYREAGGTVMEEDSPQQEDSRQLSSTGVGGGTIHFRGKNVPVENKNLRVLLLKLEGLLAEAPKSDDKFMSVLSIYDDAITIVSGDLVNVQSMKAGPAVNAKKAEMEGLLGYAKHAKLKLLMRRNEDMVNDLRKESPSAYADIAHLYDALLQDARAVWSLPGPDVEDEFILEANANVLRLRALRCYYAGQLYASSNKPAEGLALLKQATLLRSRASEEIAACENMEHLDEYLDALELLRVDIAGATCRVKAQARLSRKGGSGGVSASYRPLLLRLDEFDGGRVLADVPPVPIPIPCKPTFFDMAWDYASAIPVDELQKHIDEHGEQKSKGLLGWFRG